MRPDFQQVWAERDGVGPQVSGPGGWGSAPGGGPAQTWVPGSELLIR